MKIDIQFFSFFLCPPFIRTFMLEDGKLDYKIQACRSRVPDLVEYEIQVIEARHQT